MPHLRCPLVLLTAASLLFLCGPAAGQTLPADTVRVVELPPLVVTATRSARELERVPVPTTLITEEAMRSRGALRLSDVLAEETGLMLFEDHGTGIQVQGFDPAYTLILIDGDPVIGRTAGTLDLDRLSIADVARVEVVRGPSSSLYGSEALAGVINLITRAPEAGPRATVSTRYETHGTVDVSAEGSVRRDRLGARLTVDRYSSAGYDLTPATPGHTAPGFTDYTVSGRTDVDLSDRTQLRLDARLATQRQQNDGLFLDGADEVPVDDRAERTDWSITPRIRHRFGRGVTATAKLYAARYQTRTELVGTAGGDVFSRSRFDQGYGKAEVQLDATLGTAHLLTAGGGYVRESVEADRIAGARRRMTSGFAFLQHEYLPAGWLDVITSARIDVHSAYGTHLSPKVALLVQPAGRVRLRASVGSGFKAPTFQQLYMDFTNATVGYSVYGSVGAREALQRLAAAGQVVRFLQDVEALASIEPESSMAFNVGGEWEVRNGLELHLNLFHNEVQDLIETAPVAVKANGQSAYTYFNLNRIYTRGAEAEVTVRPWQALSASVGYQYLLAKDRDVLDAIDAGTLYRRVDGRDRRVTRADYGGLMNRSRHAWMLRLAYNRPGFTASLRGQYRSRYGFGDANGNLILDTDGEYVPGYWLWHATLTKDLGARFSVQAGARNLLGETNHEMVPSLSGRLLFAGLRVKI